MYEMPSEEGKKSVYLSWNKSRRKRRINQKEELARSQCRTYFNGWKWWRFGRFWDPLNIESKM